jgi:hypothetical protein
LGEDKYGYKYRMTKKRANGSMVFQCCRAASDSTDHCLWLYDGHWIATVAPTTCADPINNGDPQSRTCEVVADITANQWLQWSWFEASTLEWKGKMGFQTYPIMPMPAVILRRDSQSSAAPMPVPSSPTMPVPSSTTMLADSAVAAPAPSSTTMPAPSTTMLADSAGDPEQSQADTAISESQHEEE